MKNKMFIFDLNIYFLLVHFKTNGQQDVITDCRSSTNMGVSGESGSVCWKVRSSWWWSGPPVFGVIKNKLK